MLRLIPPFTNRGGKLTGGREKSWSKRLWAFLLRLVPRPASVPVARHYRRRF